MSLRHRNAVFLLLFTAVLSLVLLSSGLSGTEVSTEWQLFSRDDNGEQGRANGSLNELLNNLPKIPDSILQILYLTFIIAVPLAIVFSLLSAETRRAILHELKRALSLAIWFAAIAYVIRLWQKKPKLFVASTGGTTLDEAPEWIRNPSAVLAFGLTLLLLTAVLAVGWFLWRKMRPHPLRQLAQEAETAIGELRNGRDFKNTIIECYANMCIILRQERRIERARGMTPREFATRLERFGLAGPQAQRLTRLFEKVRYGTQPPTDQDRQEAITCLETIVHDVNN